MIMMEIKRGDVYYANLNPIIGSEQGGLRPVLVIQNNLGNHYGQTVIVALLTRQIKNKNLPTHIEIEFKKDEFKPMRRSVVLCEQLRTLDKKRLISFIGSINKDKMNDVNKGLARSIDLLL